MTPAWSPTRPNRSTPSLSLTSCSRAKPGPTHLLAPRVLETRLANRDPGRRPLDSPLARGGAVAEARWTLEICWGNIQLQGLELPTQLFLATPRTTSPRRLCAATFFAELHFPEGPTPASTLRMRSKGLGAGTRELSAAQGDPGRLREKKR